MVVQGLRKVATANAAHRCTLDITIHHQCMATVLGLVLTIRAMVFQSNIVTDHSGMLMGSVSITFLRHDKTSTRNEGAESQTEN